MVLSRQGKKDAVKQFQELMNKSKVVGLLNMEGLPSKQLQKIRKDLRGSAQILMNRKKIMDLAVEASNKKELKELGINELAQPALLFSDEDSFRLFAILKKKKMSAPAKEGATVYKDVMIEGGPTDIAPGPAMAEIQSLGLKTKVEKGKILIVGSKKVLSPGEVITKQIANVLGKLGIEPLEIGLDLVATCEASTIFTREVLDVDKEQYYNNIVSAAQKAFNLSVNAGIPTTQNITHIIQTAFQKAKNLGVNAEILDSGIVGDLIAKAANEAKALDAQLDIKVPETKVEETKESEKVEKVEEKKSEPETEKTQEVKEESKSEEKKGD